MGLMQEFKEFAIKGNAVDMAVGLVIGGAFGKIVSSLVEDVIMPLVSTMGNVDFTTAGTVLKKGATPAEDIILKYGSFMQNIVDFLIIAFSIFMVVKLINSMKKGEEEAAEPSKTEALLEEIRDNLNK